MELKEVFDIIDATLGMFRSFADEIENGDLKEKFLMTPVYTSVENVFDANKNSFEIETRYYYNYVEGDKEYKRYIVDIRPVCSYLVNDWPSYKAKRIRKRLIAVTSECANYCETYLGGIADVAEDEGFCYDRYMRTQESRHIEIVMLDTLHEMCHALSLTEHEEPDEKQEYSVAEEKRNYAKEIDWARATNNFNLNAIESVVKTGRNKRERRNIIKAIYDAMIATGEMYKIPYGVDKFLMDLFKENDGSSKGLLKAYDESNETLYIDEFIQYAIIEYMESHTATDASIDEIFLESSKSVKIQGKESEGDHVDNLSSSDKKIKTAVEIMKKEKVIKHLYDYAYIMEIMNETEELPSFNSPKSFLDYFKGLGITDLPGKDSIKKKVNATFGNHPSWTFTDTKGKDANEAKRRNALGNRYLSIYRKGK